MDVEWVRQHCLSFPHSTEQVQWGSDLVFKIGGKMFAVVPLEPALNLLSFKAAPEEFAELLELPGIVPAPYLARAHWVSVQSETALPRGEIKTRLRKAYELVLAGLPKKTREGLPQRP